VTARKRNWLIGIGLALAAGLTGIYVAASILARRFEPYIREQAIAYLRQRFDSEVELASLKVRMPATSPLRLLTTKGRGSVAHIEGSGLVLRHKGRRDVPPMFVMHKFRFDVDLGKLFDTPKMVPLVTLDGMEITLPPKGQRPKLSRSDGGADTEKSQATASRPAAIIEQVVFHGAKLVILPRDPKKVPLRFEIHELRLRSVGVGMPMKYEATLTNPKPPGEIKSTGTFGPWNAEEPGDSPLAGDYVFDKADLGVFQGIAGILHSTGRFEGALDSITAKGQATVPDFRLKMAGNHVPLATTFEVLVDGTNGNTVLKPVVATLGTTRFTTSGAVIKHDGDQRRTIGLDVLMPDGDLRDLLRLATKGQSFMEGRIRLKTRLDIPPLSGKVREKLRLKGSFDVTQAKFLRSTIQNQLDSLSRRAQGQPKNEEIDEVVSRITGAFQLQNEVVDFERITFGVPGADVDLAGKYDLNGNTLDFHGALKLQAKVSQTTTGWKRWALKPVDPFFSKKGAGTYLPIKVDGTSRQPHFGLNLRHKAGS
jgi:hypothetical protein